MYHLLTVISVFSLCWVKIVYIFGLKIHHWNNFTRCVLALFYVSPYSAVGLLSLHILVCVCRTCVSHCPLGHYEDIVSRRCRRCYKGCERCVGRSAGDCLSCRRGLYLNTLNSSCVDTCPPGYFADESKSTCTQCRSNTDGTLFKVLCMFLIHYTFCHSAKFPSQSSRYYL